MAAAPGAAPAAGFRPGWRGAGALLRAPVLRRLLAGQAAGQLADGLAQVAFAQLVLFEVGSGATPGRIASVLAATLVPFSVVGPFAGAVLDRWDRRRTLVLTSLCRAAVGLGAVAVSFAHSAPPAYAGVLLLLSCSRFVLDAKGAVLPRTVAPGELVRANAVSGLVGMSAAFLGAVAGSVLVDRTGAAAGFLAAAAGYALAAGTFVRLPWVGGGPSPGTRPAGAGGAARAARAAVRDAARSTGAGLAVIARTRRLRGPLLAVTTHRALLGAGFVLLVLVADQRYRLRLSGYGLALGVAGTAAFVGTVLAPWLAGRWRPTALLAAAFLPPAAAAYVAGAAPGLVGLTGALAVTAVCFQVVKVVTDALLGRGAPDRVRGRVFAAYDVLYNVAFVAAGLVMVPLWHPQDVRGLLWGLAAAFVLGWLAVARLLRERPGPGSAAGADGGRRAGAGGGRRAGAGGGRRAGPGGGRRAGNRVPRAGALVAGALPVLCFPAPGWWWLAWAALVPWLLVVRAAPSAREAAVRGWCAAGGFLLAVHHWLLPSTGPFLPLVAVLLAVLWLPWSLAAHRLLAGSPGPARSAAALLVLPAGWVLVEAVRSWSALGGPWAVLGTSQWNAPALLAAAALGGAWLVSLLLVTANVGLVLLVVAARARPRLLAAGAVAAAVAVGPIRDAARPAVPPDGAARIAVVQPGVVRGAAARLAREVALTRTVPPGSAELIVWGESSVGADLATNPRLAATLTALARDERALLLVGVDARTGSGRIEKVAVLLGPDGVLGSYVKTRLVPFGEYIPLRPVLGWLADLTRAAARDRVGGTGPVVLDIPGGPVFAPLICFEVAFPDLARTVARAGAEMIVYQSSSSTFQDSWEPDQQAALAAVRAVETGRPVVAAALTGTSAAFTAQGRRLAWFDTGQRGVLRLRVPLAVAGTPYLRLGDWVLAWAVAVAAAAGVVATVGRPVPPPR